MTRLAWGIGWFLALVVFTAVAGAQGDAPGKAIDDLQAEYIRRVERENQPDRLSAHAAAYSGLAWCQAARYLADQNNRRDDVVRLDRLELEVEATRGSPSRFRLQSGLRLKYEALQIAAAVRAAMNKDTAALDEIRNMDEHLALQAKRYEDPAWTTATLTNGVVGLLALNVRLARPSDTVLEETRRLFAHATRSAQDINGRTDLHHQSRLMLLTLNSARAAVDLERLLALSLEPDLKPQMDALVDEWHAQLLSHPGPQPGLIVTWNVLALFSFPTAQAAARRW